MASAAVVSAAPPHATSKKKKRKKKKKKPTPEQILASGYVRDWAFSSYPPSPPSAAAAAAADDDYDFAPPKAAPKAAERVVFELHAHSNYSDGFLSPAALVERAHKNRVKVLALTDHDTMAGIPEAMEAAHKFGIRIIPGVEISALYSAREEDGTEEPVHILAYYGDCGPASFEDLEDMLATIREGRYLRAKEMLLKLKNLEMPLKWEHVAKIAGTGVAPGRLHVARAMVEAGYVENLKQAFSRYLYDGGPAYAMGSEPSAENVVQLICDTGGVAALAHPWALKNPVAIIRCLKAAGLHALEVYRSDGILAGFNNLADTHELLKLGGSDYHGRGGHEESELGSVYLPVQAVYNFLKLARPIWCNAMKEILSNFAEEPTNMNLEKILGFRKLRHLKGYSTISCGRDAVDLFLSSWVTDEEREAVDFEAIRLKLSCIFISRGGLPIA